MGRNYPGGSSGYQINQTFPLGLSGASGLSRNVSTYAAPDRYNSTPRIQSRTDVLWITGILGDAGRGIKGQDDDSATQGLIRGAYNSV